MSKDDQFELDFGIGKISFNSLHKWIELASQLENQGVRKEGEIKGLPKNFRGTYGINIKTLVNDKSIAETFGENKDRDKTLAEKEVKEPLADIFDESDLIVVIAELPGVAEQEINIEIKEQILHLSAWGREKNYYSNIILPSPVIPSSMKIFHNNEVLKIILQKGQERKEV